jgi:hypothetical protein
MLFKNKLKGWKDDLDRIIKDNRFGKLAETNRLKEEFQKIRDDYKGAPAERARRIAEFKAAHPDFLI